MVAPVRWDPVGWAPRGGYKGEGPMEMGTRKWAQGDGLWGWSPRGWPQGVGSRWVRLSGVGPRVTETGVGPMLVGPRGLGTRG